MGSARSLKLEGQRGKTKFKEESVSANLAQIYADRRRPIWKAEALDTNKHKYLYK